jgi:hypothetical protein
MFNMKLLIEFYKKLNVSKSPISIAIYVALIATLFLIIPLLAMLFTDEMNWSFFDFVAAWILLFGSGFTYKIIARSMGGIIYRAAIGLSVATALFLVWSNLAVGLIGSEDNSANLMYMGVLAIGFLGSIIVRLKPRGMSLVLFAMAFSHIIISVIALIVRLDLLPESSVIEILAVNGFFFVLWCGAALMFRNAAYEQSTVKTVKVN